MYPGGNPFAEVAAGPPLTDVFFIGSNLGVVPMGRTQMQLAELLPLEERQRRCAKSGLMLKSGDEN